ncbi:MAG: TIR domain-containing protein [Bacteroidetes bacterium]|nr:TIR domain-containing protein [Bacteroidota bacterium]
MAKINIFISYSHEDEIYKDKLEKHLSLLKRNNIIETWCDRKIVAGEEWDKKIKGEIENAHIILLLVSVDFLNSNFCYDIEIKRAVEKHDNGEAVVIPIILRKCDWQETSFSRIQALPKNAQPVKNFNDEDEAFFSITEGIKAAITKYQKNLKETTKEEITSEPSPLEILHKAKVECDTPPNILHWVGRQKEINEIDLDLHKVVFISGIGGQGKSGLASHYIKEIAIKKPIWEFWDWRDCQEKENRIHTKIISIISRLTNNRIMANQISEASIDDLIDLLFQELGSRKIVFVFDNIDAYIEFENFQLTGAVQKLYLASLTKNHCSKFIFTCRTSINDIDTELLTINLQGLSLEETKDLFSDYDLSLKNEDVILLAEKSYTLTRGHLLWLNLIAAQARRGLDVAEKFIQGILPNSNFQEDSLSSILSKKILGAIWNSLNEKQKTLLMAFAEIVRAENQENLSKILSSELNYNQFSKAFKALKQLNLIVIKSMLDEQDTFELHPLVKEFVIQNFGRVERSKFISLFFNFYDNVILVLKPKLNSEQPLNFFENWTAKIELAVNKDDYKSALVALEEVCVSICEAGYVEEYIRVANLVFVNIDWRTALNEEYSYFNSQFTKFVDTLTEFGKFDEASAFLTKYEKLITSKGINYIRYCKTKGHFYWFQNKFNEAIELLEEGIILEEQSNSKSGLDLRHTLALSLRDTKHKDNISKALEIFLNGKDINKLILEKDDNFISGETYGNVGRCLHYNGNISDALICYKKSLQKLKDPMNKGYAYLWYAECMILNNQIDTALWFYRQAFYIWNKFSPIKSITIDKKIKSIIEVNPSLITIAEIAEKEVEKYCLNILRNI